MRSFDIGQNVFVENVRGEPRWLPGVVLEKVGEVSYPVQVGEGVWPRHADQMRCGNEEMESAVTNPEPSDTMVSDPGSAEDTPLVEPSHNR